jgi:hypothetical protein
MPTHYFHCTDGVDFVLDRHGCEVDNESEVQRLAARAVTRLMQRLPAYRDWTSWLVSVHDEGGFLIDRCCSLSAERSGRHCVRGQAVPHPARERS